ncbi:MAG: DNA gyrase inhibitor YacG [Mariprofundaceae bacterium]
MKQDFFCPICKKIVHRNAEHFPFCRERCRVIDLGNWSDGSYAIAAEPVNLKLEEEEGGEERLH